MIAPSKQTFRGFESRPGLRIQNSRRQIASSMGWAVHYVTRTSCLVDWSQHNRWAHNATRHQPVPRRLGGIAARLGAVASFVLRAVD